MEINDDIVKKFVDRTEGRLKDNFGKLKTNAFLPAKSFCFLIDTPLFLIILLHLIILIYMEIRTN